MDKIQLLEQTHLHGNPEGSNINKLCTILVLISSALLLFLVITLNVVFDMSLFVLGINFIYEIQNAMPSNIIHTISNLISYLCKTITMGILIVISYILINRKLMLLVYLSFYFIANYIYHILNQAIQETRPFWYDPRIFRWEWSCPDNFGSPSGHSLNAVIFLQPIISDGLGFGKFKFVWALIILFIALFVPLCRVYLGSHSVNQIFFGMSLGAILLVLYKYIYQKSLYLFFWSSLIKGSNKLRVFGIVLLNIIIIGLPIGLYEINLRQRPIYAKYLQNLNAQCKTHSTGQELQSLKLIDCSVGCFVFGVLYGLLILKNDSNSRAYLLGLWSHETIKKRILKMGVYVLCTGLPFGFFYLISKLFVTNSIYKYLLNCGGIMGLGLGLSLLTPFLTFKLNIMSLKTDLSKND